MATATEIFNRRVELFAEAEAVYGRTGSLGITPTARARAVQKVIREEPALHAAYIKEFNEAAREKEAAKFRRC